MAKAGKPNVAALVRAARAYDDNLMGRIFLVIGIGRHGDVEYIEIRFSKGNFQHLTGAKTRTSGMAPDEFFDRCVESRLAEADLDADARGYVALKLRAAKQLFAPGLPVASFGTGNSSHLLLSADRIAGGKAGVLGLKLIADGAHVPITMLDANIRDEGTDLHDVVAVFSKRFGEAGYGNPEFTRDKAMGSPVDWDTVRDALPSGLEGLRLPCSAG